MTITNSEDLGKQIERTVREFIATSRTAAESAMRRAFASTPGAAEARPVGRPARNSRRRTPEEIAAMAQRLHDAVSARPGETMAVLAMDLGASASELHLSMSKLKGAGRVRSAGQRHLTRYFPMARGATPGA